MVTALIAPISVGTLSKRVLGLLAETMGNLDRAAQHFDDALAFYLAYGSTRQWKTNSPSLICRITTLFAGLPLTGLQHSLLGLALS